MKKRILCTALALLMLLGLIPVGTPAYADFEADENGVVTVTADLDEYALAWRDDVKKVIIGKDVVSIDFTAFAYCTALESFEVDPGNETFYANDGVLFQKSPSVLICYPAAKTDSSYTVPGGVTGIADRAFMQCQLNNVKIPDGVVSIGSGAFSYSTALNTVTLPSGLKKIDAYTFSCCSALQSMSIPDGVTEIGECAFESCTALESVEIPDSMKCIGEKAFSGCSELKTVNIPEGANVAENAFNLTQVTVTHTHSFGDWQSDADKHWRECKCGERAEEGAHSGEKSCTQCGRDLQSNILDSGTTGDLTWTLGTDGVLSIDGSGTMPEYAVGLSDPPWYLYREKINSVKIGEGPKSIGCDAFSGCFYLSGVELSSTVENVDTSAFGGCTGFKEYKVSEENKTYSAADGMLMRGNTLVHCPQGKTAVSIPETTVEIAAKAFKNCSGSVQIALPNSVRTIGEAAFENCAKLQTVAIPNGVTAIPGRTFANCSALESVSIPSSVESIGSAAFSGCASLKSVTIPDGVTVIHDDTFSGCAELESVTVPASVTSVGKDAFTGCAKLKTVDFRGTDTQWKALTVASGNSVLGDADVSCKVNEHVHKYTSVVTAPTCTSAGYTTHRCECSHSYTDSEVPALGHKYDDGVCLRCGVKDPNFKSESDTHEHKFEPTVIAPTCEKEGYTLYSCSCGENYTKEYVSAAGHKTVLKNAKAATCTEAGSTGDMVCTVCSATIKSGESIPATGHKTELKNVKAASCTADGYSGDKVCTVCGETVEKGTVIPKTEHKFVGGACSVCGEKEAVELPMFSDVSTDMYYYEAVYWALQNGITNGTGGTTFSPDLGCTRAQIVMFLWRAAGCPTSNASLRFEDVSAGDMCYDAVRWAVETGMTTGTSATTFSPYAPCTRAQIVTLLYRMESEPKTNGVCAFSDVPHGAYFESAVIWATGRGITNGTGGGYFIPEKVCTRAEVVTMLYRWQ